MAYTNAAIDRQRGLPGHRGPRRAVLRLRPGDRAPTTRRSWQYEGRSSDRRRSGRTTHAQRETASALQHETARRRASQGDPPRDETLQHPRCVYQILKRHFARYTPEMVEQVCGVSAGAVPRGLRGVDGELRPRAHHRAGLQRRLDPAQRRRAVHPHRRDHPAAAGQHGPARAAASWRCAGTPASRARPTSRRCSTCCPATCRCPTPATARQPRATGSTASRQPGPEGLLAQRRRLHGLPAQGVLGRGRDRGERLLLRLPAAASPATTAPTARSWTWSTARCSATSCSARTRPSARRTAGCSGSAWPTSTGWSSATSSRSRARRSGRTRPEIETGEIVPEDCRTEVFFFPAASHVEKEGTFTQTQRMLQWREKAVEPPGDRRSELWFFYHLGRMLRERLAGSDRRAGPAAAGPGLGLRDGRADEPERRGRAARDQRLRPRHRTAAVDDYIELKADGSTIVRLLDLQRRLRRRGQPGRAAQAARPSRTACAPGVGLGLADEPADPLQPGVGRPGGQAVERAQEARLVGRRSDGRVDRPRRAGLREDQAAVLPRRPRARSASEALRGDDPFIMQADGKGWLFAPNGPARRAAADALRAARVAVPQPALRPAGQPDAQGVRPRRTTRRTRRRRSRTARCSRSCSPRPADRAPHGGRHEPLAAVPVRAAAGDVRRGVAGAGRASAAWRTWAGPRGHQPRPRSRPGCW